MAAAAPEGLECVHVKLTVVALVLLPATAFGELPVADFVVLLPVLVLELLLEVALVPWHEADLVEVLPVSSLVMVLASGSG